MRATTLFLALGALGIGCGKSDPPLTDTVVTGKVTLGDVTLTMGEVYFESLDGKQSGRGEILSTGEYRVPSAPVGKVKAAVRTANYAQYAKTQMKGGKAMTIGGREGTYISVPKKYEDVTTSGLTFDVEPGRTIDIRLTK